ncbi:MAG: hypothetical protein RL154_1685, partial [Pseudomonadota bacterium]
MEAILHNSYLDKIKLSGSIILLVSLVACVAVWLMPSATILIILITGTINTICAFLIIRSLTEVFSFLDKIHFAVKNASEGKLEDRITSIKDTGRLAKTAWAINDLLDQVESFMRESHTAIHNALEG